VTTWLVTGGTGFIGRVLIDHLLAEDASHRIRSFSLPGEPIPDAWKERVDLLHGDISSPADVESAFDGVDCAIHLASLLGAGSYADHRSVTVEGTRNVLEAALGYGSRVVVVSSIAVYGDFVRDRVCSEDQGHGPHYGPYSLAKQEQEDLANVFANKRGLNCCIARPANVTGRGSLPWVTVVSAALAQKAPIIVDGGLGDAGLIHVKDVASALIRLAEHGKRGKAYNVSADMEVSWHRYFSDIANAMGVPLPEGASYGLLEELARRDEDPERLVTPKEYRSIPLATLALIGSDNRFPNSRIRKETGWEPQVSYQETIEEIRRSFVQA